MVDGFVVESAVKLIRNGARPCFTLEHHNTKTQRHTYAFDWGIMSGYELDMDKR